jgi:hypothetical protein
VNGIVVTPISAKKRREIKNLVAKRYAKYRKDYPEIRGKKIDWVTAHIEEGLLYVGLRFTDKTYFSLQFSPEIVTDGIEFSDMSTGDNKILRTYYRRRDR